MTAQTDRQKWVVIAEFFRGQEDRWLDDFIVEKGIVFEKIASPAPHRDWHSGRSKLTPLVTWFDHLRHTRAALRHAPVGIIACFPQLAISAAFWKRLGRTKPRIVAYNFNLGGLRPGLRQLLARAVAGQVDCFVVHSPEEVARYAGYLGVPLERVRFVPLQRGEITIPRDEDTEVPFLVAMGSAHRDYPTLIGAVDRLGLPTVIVTRASDIEALPKSPHVTFRFGMTERECLELMARARICVTPIANMTTASGQVTFINAMQLGVPVIATRCPGTDGYIEHDRDGLLVEPFDVDNMTATLDRLWQDGPLRERLAGCARSTARERFSDQAAANRLLEMIQAMAKAPMTVAGRS